MVLAAHWHTQLGRSATAMAASGRVVHARSTKVFDYAAEIFDNIKIFLGATRRKSNRGKVTEIFD